MTQASFSAVVKDGIPDLVITKAGQSAWFDYFPDGALLFPHELTQGKLGVSVSNPASGSKVATCTITASQKTTKLASA